MMENRNRRSNSSRYARYDQYYGTDRNAALAPVRVPLPERQQHTAPRVKPRPKPKAKKWVALIMLTAVVSTLGCVVVNRNAMIYQNNIEIRRMSKSINEAETMVNTVELDLASSTDVDQYLVIAEDQLNMNYPTDDQLLVIEPATETKQDTDDLKTEPQERKNIYDMVLDWINSLERRI